MISQFVPFWVFSVLLSMIVGFLPSSFSINTNVSGCSLRRTSIITTSPKQYFRSMFAGEEGPWPKLNEYVSNNHGFPRPSSPDGQSL